MTVFHKAHYDILSEVLQECDAPTETKVKIAEVFKRDNKYFKPAKFLTAAGVEREDINAVIRAGRFE